MAQVFGAGSRGAGRPVTCAVTDRATGCSDQFALTAEALAKACNWPIQATRRSGGSIIGRTDAVAKSQTSGDQEWAYGDKIITGR